MEINQNAPLKSKKDITIFAPIDIVWSLITDIDSWPNWQPDVSFAKLDGKFSKGSTFKWKAKGLNISSEIQEIVTQKIISWSGKSLGMKAIHIWKLEQEDNITHVTTNESLSGWMPVLLKFFDREFLDKSLSGSLLTLKNESEKVKGIGR